ncbi:Coenzyme PQQ synthesis protein D (PqqD) [Paenibacillus sp. 1_12]|uniref:lasso peptide biosynthesis PqqD family chaperone n=1 Tax=Paenibacillus sp. 1_12 TaxID=1566278 RepID=UPI0008E59249|nr:lasso peptide biosynthesis PqqD family chaperone [Paenibacillus sp. 1_12]SFL10836.1 Coenzyme PQQ synthesis protein D (PqqD) [Paenibacillus sp. 1_12]
MIKQQTISLNDTVVQGKGYIVSSMGGEKVMLSINNGKYYNLGKIGGSIWDHIEKQITVNELIAVLMSEYEVKQPECEKQVISFLEVLLANDLILVGEAISI